MGTFFITRTKPRVINRVTAVAMGVSTMGFIFVRLRVKPK